MNYYESLFLKRHEVRVQELRRERKMETKRLEQMKVGLQTKLQAAPAKSNGTRAA